MLNDLVGAVVFFPFLSFAVVESPFAAFCCCRCLSFLSSILRDRPFFLLFFSIPLSSPLILSTLLGVDDDRDTNDLGFFNTLFFLSSLLDVAVDFEASNFSFLLSTDTVRDDFLLGLDTGEYCVATP